MKPHPKTPEELRPLLGASTEEAIRATKAVGYAHRVTREDGEPRLATRDVNRNRVNLHTEGGRVVAAYFG